MVISFVEKKYKIADRFKSVITEKLCRLDKYFPEEANARVVASSQNKIEKLEISIISKGVLYRAEVSGNNNYDNIDLVLPKLEKQIVRSKQKAKTANLKQGSTKKAGLTYEFLDNAPNNDWGTVAKTKTFDLDPITVEDAKDALERTDHSFYVFLNVKTGKVNILYKRKDAHFGLIEVNY